MNYNSIGVIFVILGWISMALYGYLPIAHGTYALKDILFVLGTGLIFIGLVSFNMDNSSSRNSTTKED